MLVQVCLLCIAFGSLAEGSLLFSKNATVVQVDVEELCNHDGRDHYWIEPREIPHYKRSSLIPGQVLDLDIMLLAVAIRDLSHRINVTWLG